jgi:hypothetical protein
MLVDILFIYGIIECEGDVIMEQKKILIFDDKMFYNARHLYNYLDKYYSSVHKLTFFQVQDATGKRLKSIDKFFKVTYDYVHKSRKDRVRRYMQINEGYEEIVCFDSKTVDDFLIKYLGVKDIGYLFIYKNPKKEIILAYKESHLRKIIQKYNKDLADIFLDKIKQDSIFKGDYYHYMLKPTSVKQNIF